MNGAHDLGGQHGFGPVEAEPDEPAFHAEWERRAFALTLAMGATGEWNLDASRFARESLPPAEYLTKTYYEIWLAGLERLIAERGLVTDEELAAGEPLTAPPTHTRLPRYVRGHAGSVVAVHGAHVFPDAHAHGGGEDPQWLYTVRFEARELWGDGADPTVAVSVDAFEPYLEPA